MTYNYASNPFIDIPIEQFGIFTFLEKSTPPKSSVLALYMTGNQIPAFTRNTVYMGHGLQTPNAISKLTEEQTFYRGEYSLSEARNFLLKNNISYVVWGIEEKSYYQTNAKIENHLKEIFSRMHIVYLRNGIAVFSVDKKRLQ